MATLIVTGLTAFAQNQPRNFDCSTATGVTQGECETLVAFYNSTNGASWTNKNNWLSATNVCTWQGISCGSGSVHTINLFNNNISGPLPVFGVMPELREVYLMSNNISGELPASLNGTNFPKLTTLSLSGNDLSGSIPASIGGISTLTHLNLSNNLLTGTLPSELANLTALNTILVGDNQLSGPIPDLSAACGSLYGFGIANNTGIGGTFPSWITAENCPGIKNILFANTGLTGDFPDLTGMDLLSLSLDNNNLTAGPIPDALINMPSLSQVNLPRTNRTGTIPVFVSTNIIHINLSSNLLTGDLPAGYNSTSYPSLQRLYLSGLQISQISDSTATLTSLITFDVRSNKLKRSNLSATVQSFLDAEAIQWESRQTIPPTYSATATNSTTIQVTGTGIPLYGADQGIFEVLTSATEGGPYTLAGSATGTMGSFTVNLTGQTPESTVYLVVRSKTTGGGGSAYPQTVYSDNGLEVSVTLPEVVDPTTKPTKPVLTYPGGFNDKVSGTKSPNFSWNPNAGAEGVTQYRLTVKNKATGATVFNKLFNAADICTTFCLVSLSTQNPVISLANGAYTAQLSATNIIGTTKGNLVDFSLVKPTKPTLTAPIGGVTINDPTPTLTFTLDLFQNITDVKVTVTKDGASTPAFNQTFLRTAVCTGSNCAVNLPTALGNGLYSWKAELINVNGKSAATGEFKIAFPDKATGLAPTANATIDTQKPTLTWNEVANAAEYRVTITHTSGTKVVIDWIASGATGFVCDSGVCTLDLSAISSVPNLKKGAQEWFVEARNTTIHPQSKSKSAVAKFKIVLPVRGSTNGALPLPPDTFRAP